MIVPDRPGRGCQRDKLCDDRGLVPSCRRVIQNTAERAVQVRKEEPRVVRTGAQILSD